MKRVRGRSAAIITLTAGLLSALIVPVAARAQTGTLPGIDVSRWQGTIDWSQVAGAGIRFVFMKATDGRSLLDPTYSTNRAGAKAAGIRVGTYHFARPEGSTGDAKAEAQFFVENAVIEAGGLPPVLDIEENGGLSAAALTDWALDWLSEVRRLTGVRPLVYTSPNGWKTRFGNTTRVADAGYDLWLAHWTTGDPIMPANNWGGRGWTVWQYSDCGRISGISTCVDLDRFNGTNLNPITLRSLTVSLSGGEGTVKSDASEGIDCGTVCSRLFDGGAQVTLTATTPVGSYLGSWSGACSGSAETCSLNMTSNRSVTANFIADDVPPTVEVIPPKEPTGPISLRFSEIVRSVSSDAITVKRKSGAGVPGELVCRAGGGGIVDCATGQVKTVAFQPSDTLVEGGEYVITLRGSDGGITDRARNPLESEPIAFAVPIPVTVEESDATVVPGWKKVAAAAAVGGSYVAERSTGASASFRFTGTAVSWLTLAGPTMGVAQVKIDGKAKGTYDLGAGSLAKKVVRFTGLVAREHTITVVVTGKAGSGGGTLVAVDGFKVGTQTTAEPTMALRWRTVTSTLASSGKWAMSNLAGSQIQITFSGSSIAWTTQIGPDQGKAKVFIDGKAVGTFDNYAETAARFARVFEGLSSGSHTLRIVVTGTARAGATGTWITVDGFTPR